MALPLAMAFAIASGLTPQAGIYCAVVTGFLISALGGSKTQIGGPTGAFVVVVAGIVAVHGVDGLFMCTVMAGVLLIILGVTGMGTAVKFIPRPIVIGFTNGIAVLIASTQIKDLFGLRIDKIPGVFWLRMESIAANFHTLSYTATVLGVGTLVTLLVCRALSNRIPGPIVAMVAGTIAVVALKLPVETIGTRFGGIPSGLPHFAIPRFRADLHRAFGDAFGEIADSFEIAGDADGANQFAQVDRHGLAARDRHHRHVFDFALERVEAGIGRDDLVREHSVGVGQCVHRLDHHFLRDAPHFGNAALERVELLVVGLDGMFDHGSHSLSRSGR